MCRCTACGPVESRAGRPVAGQPRIVSLAGTDFGSARRGVDNVAAAGRRAPRALPTLAPPATAAEAQASMHSTVLPRFYRPVTRRRERRSNRSSETGEECALCSSGTDDRGGRGAAVARHGGISWGRQAPSVGSWNWGGGALAAKNIKGGLERREGRAVQTPRAPANCNESGSSACEPNEGKHERARGRVLCSRAAGAARRRSRQQAQRAALLQQAQRAALLHHVAGGHADVGHGAVAGRRHRVLHLHGLQHNLRGREGG